ncbi:MAG TPA: M20/M25/M40 family metallo-hydrolase [Elusimicrobiota bacterium]|nr:M20/M25/M40 family metallo-hydrolase [Elusimicrobiota bacterium]
MKPGALPLFQHLTSVPTAPFREKAVAGKAKHWIAKHLGRRVSVREVRGGIIVSYRGAGAGPALALAAHLDHPAFRLDKITRDGAMATLQGGLPPHLLPGEAVELWPAVPKDNVPLGRGVLGDRPKKDGDLWTIRWTEPPKGKPVFATLALTPYEVEDGWLSSRSVDDLLGCAVSLEAMRRLANARAKTNVTVLLNRAEEVGFVGALDMIASGVLSPDDSYLSIESSRELPGSKPGKGPTIRLGDKACAFDPNLLALLDEAGDALRKRGAGVQRLRLTGGTCEATAYLTFGLEAAGVAVPLVNYHNGWGAEKIAPERVRVSDVEGAVRLLVEAAKLFPSKILRGTLRDRLTKRRALSAAALAAR